MKVISYRVGQKPEVVEIDNDLTVLQSYVGGYIEVIQISHADINCLYLLVCNEEGKIKKLPTNRPIYNDEYELIDIICGDFFICRASEDDFISIEDGDSDVIDYIECIGEAMVC